MSACGRKIWRLSRRGNRRLNHAIHMAAVTQIRNRHSQGRAYFEKKLAEGKTRKEALRALKRQISDAIYACLQAGARRAAGAKSPGGQRGNDSLTSAAGSHPQHRLFGKATPGPATHPTTPADAAADPAPAAFPPGRHRARAGGRVKDRAKPGRAAAPAGRPLRSRPRADNARGGKSGHTLPTRVATGQRPTAASHQHFHLTLKQRGVRYAWPSAQYGPRRCRFQSWGFCAPMSRVA